MSSHTAPLLLSPTEVRDLSESSQLVSLLDASWFMPNSPRNPYEEFLAKRIPGAQFLDLDLVASPHELGLKHMIPPSQVFADACGMTIKPILCSVVLRSDTENFGIESTSHVIMSNLYNPSDLQPNPHSLTDMIVREFSLLRALFSCSGPTATKNLAS